MKLEEYLKNENDYIEIENNLLSTESAVKGALMYLESSNDNRKELDLEEVIAYLKTVYEETNNIRNIINKLKIKINELEEKVNERL